MYIFLGCINQLKIQRNKNCAITKQESDLKSILGRFFSIEVLCIYLMADSLLSPPHSYLQDSHLIKAFSCL